VTEQFLNDFWVFSIGIQDRTEGVTKRVPANTLLQANFVSCSLAGIRDPMGISGVIEACSTSVKKQDALSKLATGLSRAEKAVAQREEDIDKCFYWWDLFFNGRFPAR
jgi:hypothetical protein